MSALDPLVQLWKDFTQPQSDSKLLPVDPKSISSQSPSGERLICKPTGIETKEGKSLYLCEPDPDVDLLDQIFQGFEGIFGSTLESFTDRLREHTSSRASAPEDVPSPAPKAGGTPPPVPPKTK